MMMPRKRAIRWLVISGLCYAAMLAAVVWSLAEARRWALAELATPESISEWQTWRDDVERQKTEPGPVARRVPKSSEPPGLVLMRDYFAICLVGALIFTSLLYWVLVWFANGMLNTAAITDTSAQAI